MYQRWWISLAFSVALVAASIALARPAHSADAVMCVNCGSEVTQLATQAQQLQAQLNQYQNMLTNSKGVSQNVWGNAIGDIQKLQNLLQQSKALAGTAGNLDGQFASRYGTYRSYLNQKMGASDWQNKYNQWSNEANDNTLYTLKGLGMQASQMQNEQAVIRQLQAMSGTAEGRMQAMQVANMFASQNLDQILKLRQLMMMQIQMQANYMAQQQDRQAASDAATQRFYNFQTLQRDGKTY